MHLPLLIHSQVYPSYYQLIFAYITLSFKFAGDVYEAQSEAQSDEEEELSAQDLINFAPVYRCLHISSVLGTREKFEAYYREQRMEQARLALQSPNNMVRIEK